MKFGGFFLIGMMLSVITTVTLLGMIASNTYSSKMSQLRIAVAQEQISNNYEQECISKGYKIIR